MLSTSMRPPSEPSSSLGSNSGHAPYHSDPAVLGSMHSNSSSEHISRASPLGRPSTGSSTNSSLARTVSNTLKPVSQQQLLAEHQDPILALQQLVKEYNTLVFTSSQQETDRTKATAENSKLWNWCGSLKRERDTLQRENDRFLRERSRFERRVADLEQTCRNAGVTLPPANENMMEEELVDGKDVKRPNNPRSLSDSSQAVRKIIALSNSESVPRQSIDRDRVNGRHRQHSAGGDSFASNSSYRSNKHPSGPRAQSFELGKSSSTINDTITASSSITNGLQHAEPEATSQYSPAPQYLAIQEESTPNKFQLAGVPSLVSPFGPLFQKSGSGTALVSSPNSPVASTHPPSPLSRGETSEDDPTDSGTDALGISRGSSAEPLQRTTTSEPFFHPPEHPPQHHRAEVPAPIKLPSATSIERVDRELLQTPIQENMPQTFHTPQSSIRPSMDSTQTAATASPSTDREARDRARRHEQKARDRAEREAAAQDSRPRASSAPQAPSPNLPSSSQLTNSAPSPGPSRSRKEGSIVLNPALLPFLRIRVVNSHIKTNDKSREVISFSICVILDNPDSKSPSQKWYVEKKYSDVLALDQLVKAKHSRSQSRKIASLPDKSLFKDHAPNKVDLRKAVLEKYLQSLASVPLQDKSDILNFLSSNVLTERHAPVANPAYKAGYLTKRGRNFGGWQTRYYVLQGPLLSYYDNQGGTWLGHIDVTGAQIGRQQHQKDADTTSAYRHAFLIRECRKPADPRRGAPPEDVDHILCAESDVERDSWVRVLAAWYSGEYKEAVETSSSQPSSRSAAAGPGPQPHSNSNDGPPRRTGRKMSKDDISVNRASAQPINQLSSDMANSKLHLNNPYVDSQHPDLVAPSLQHARHSREDSAGRSSLNNPHTSEETASAVPRYLSRRKDAPDLPPSSSLPTNLDSLSRPSLAADPPSARPSSENGHYSDMKDPQTVLVPLTSRHPPMEHSTPSRRPPSPDKRANNKISAPMNGAPIKDDFKQTRQQEDRRAKTKSSFWTNFALRSDKGALAPVQPRPVFGVPLQEAVSIARVREGFDLPAVVFRCVEYLQAKSAEQEEGLYRLSGSAHVIRTLKERFNNEGDLNLLASGEYFDPHAVAGLLKLFLRELPVHVLTRELQHNFLQVIDLSHRRDKVNELGVLVAKLPVANYTLLRFLTAHLMHVVQNEKANKMSLRNVGIVFSPTLGIPGTLFSLFLTEFAHVFRVLDDQPAPLRIEDEAEDEQPTTTDEDIPTVDPTSADESDMKRKRRSRNSMYYASTGADALLEIRGSRLEGPTEESSDDPDDEEISAESDIEEDSADDRYETATNFPTPSSPTLAMQPDLPRPGLTKQAHTHEYQRNASDKGLTIQVTDTSQDATRSPRTAPAGMHSPRTPGPSGHGPRSPGLPSSPRPQSSNR